MNIELPINPCSTVDYEDYQFGKLHNSILDHIRIHNFGIYAVIQNNGEKYTVPYNKLVRKV